MAEAYGIKETVELLAAAGDVAVVAYKAQKQATDPATGKIDIQKLGAALAALLMTSPEVIADLKAAADNISDVPKEIKDLSLLEGLQLATECGKISAKCVAGISA